MSFGLNSKTRFETTIAAFLRRELQLQMLEICDADVDEKNEKIHDLALEMGFAQTKAKDIGSSKKSFDEFKKDYIRRHPADANMISMASAGVEFGDATIRPSNSENLRISPRKKIPRNEEEFEDIALQEAQESITRNLFEDRPRTPELRPSSISFDEYQEGTSQNVVEDPYRPSTSQDHNQDYSTYTSYYGDYGEYDYYGCYEK